MKLKVFFDSNIIIDGLTCRDYSFKPSRSLLVFAAAQQIKGFITAKQITDIYYVLKHYFSTESERRRAIKMICDIFEILPTTKSDIQYCLNTKMKDLEDALIDEVCKVNCMDYLVTNNVKDFDGAKSCIATPEQLVTLLDINQ